MTPSPPLRLYDHPLYYEVAFSGGTAVECERVLALLELHAVARVGSVLEVACGTGRVALALAEHGWRAAGYDRHPAMVAFAAGRLFASDRGADVDVRLADMRDPGETRRFDAAVCLNNSLGYLHDDADIVAHLRATAACLRPGGVYVVQIGCAWEELDPTDEARWQARWHRVETDTSWRILREDHAAKRSHELCRMRVRDGERALLIEEEHRLRLWFAGDLRALAERAGLIVEAVHGPALEPLDVHGALSGELGNLYFVLRAPA